MEHTKGRSRRRHDAELKVRVLAACSEPGASVARVALTHGLNANLVHKWRRQAAGVDVVATTVRQAEAFIPLSLPSPESPVAPAGDIRIELRRGAMAVSVSWPLSAAGPCAGWLRELLK